MASQEQFCLEVRGDFACFTRPEMKVERVSYDVITPSAARAIFEAILWRPAMQWHIEKIEVLKPIAWINVRRNEVGSVASVANAKKAMNGNDKALQLLVEDDRQQRAGLFLRDVAYRLYARFSLRDDSQHPHRFPQRKANDRNDSENSYPKFAEMFKRRARRGQCFNQPYLGTREFSAHWRLIENVVGQPSAITLPAERPLGWMLYDLDYSDRGNPQPRFFEATLSRDGHIDVPAWDSDKVRG